MPRTDTNWPSGTITFLFTDIEKSTLLWDRHQEKMRTALADHDALLRTAVEEAGGLVVKTTGDGLHAVSATAASALSASLAAQRRLQEAGWAEIAPDRLCVRMGLHTGAAQWREGDYYGSAVNRAARIMDVGHGGQILLSDVTATLLQGVLPSGTSLRDLGNHPLRGLQSETHIFQLVAPDLPRDFPPLNSGRTPAGNLPAHVSSFVGRVREMAEIRSALSSTRLLTLTGPGGTGKTRLSLQLAADIQAAYADGAWLVELAPVTDPNLVVKTTAAVFGLASMTSAQMREALFDYLREKEVLLILDNCEHLIAACAHLASDLIASCPHLTILASSREGLGVYGETTYHLPTLNLPTDDDQMAESAARSDAVRLFVERAVAAQPGFKLNDANAPAVVQIVRRLDGIPLAIELAAARLKIFNVGQVAARLDQRFRLLTGGSHTAMPRQQTLRALIDWSYDLLDEDERDLFRRLSVFVGGFTFEAAERVTDPLDTFTLLPQLVSKSLVTRGVDLAVDFELDDEFVPEPRYAYLETIRQYARDRLIESGLIEEARDRHFDYYESLSWGINLDAAPALLRIQGENLLLEQDNLRAAVEWSIERYPRRTLDFLWNLTPFITDHLPGTEAIAWASSALEQMEGLPPAQGEEELKRHQARLKGMVAICLLEMFLGQLSDAYRNACEVIDLLQGDGTDPLLLANALFVKAQAGYFLEDLSLDETLAEAEAVLRGMPEEPLRQLMLAMVLMLEAETESRKGNLEEVARLYDESQAILEKAPNAFMAWLEYSRFMVTLQLDIETEQVRSQYEKVVDLLHKTRSSRIAAMAESDWGHRMRRDGNLDEALVIYQHMLVEWRRLGHRAAMANILENIAFIDRIQGRPERAVMLLAAAEQIRKAVGQDMLSAEREEYEEELAKLKGSLPPQDLDNLWTKGRAMSTDAIVDLALGEENDRSGNGS